MTGPEKPANSKMDLLVSGILRFGLLCSVIFLLTGMVWKWLLTGSVYFDYMLPKSNVLQFMGEELRQMLAGKFRPRLFINLGIAALLLTPYLRVLVSAVYFGLVEKNKKYTVFTGFVLIILTYSLMLR